MSILADNSEHPDYFGDTTGHPNDLAYWLSGLPSCKACGSRPAPHALSTIGRWLLCSGPKCDRETEPAATWEEAAKLWEQAQCPAHSWMRRENALGEHWFACAHCGVRMEQQPKPDVALCPHCGSAETARAHHAGSFAVPECDYQACEDCGHQWNHQ